MGQGREVQERSIRPGNRRAALGVAPGAGLKGIGLPRFNLVRSSSYRHQLLLLFVSHPCI